MREKQIFRDQNRDHLLGSRVEKRGNGDSREQTEHELIMSTCQCSNAHWDLQTPAWCTRCGRKHSGLWSTEQGWAGYLGKALIIWKAAYWKNLIRKGIGYFLLVKRETDLTWFGICQTRLFSTSPRLGCMLEQCVSGFLFVPLKIFSFRALPSQQFPFHAGAIRWSYAVVFL